MMVEVVFVGGPFDGHRQHCLGNTANLPQELVRLVCDDVFGQLQGAKQICCGRFTSVALYGLEHKRDARRYLFAGAISYADFDGLLRHRAYAAMAKRSILKT